MEPKPIRTLTELQEEQMKLRIRIASSKKEFLRSVGNTTTLGRQLLIQKVGVAAGVAALGIAVKRRFFSDAPNKKQETKPSGQSHRLIQLLLTALPVVLPYFFKKNDAGYEGEDDMEADGGIAPAGFYHENHTAGKWFSALIPLAVTLIQQLLEDDDEEAFDENASAHQSAKT